MACNKYKIWGIEVKEMEKKNGYLEDLASILDRIIALTDNCDSKCSIVLGGIGVIMSILLTNDFFPNCHDAFNKIKDLGAFWSIILTFFAIISILAFIIGLIFLFLVLVPSTDPNKYRTAADVTNSDKTGNKEGNKNAPSLIFFGAVAQKTNFSEYLNNLTNPGQSNDTKPEKSSKEPELSENQETQVKLDPWQKDYIIQIYVCSKICNKKFSRYKTGLLLSGPSCLILFVLAIIVTKIL